MRAEELTVLVLAPAQHDAKTMAAMLRGKGLTAEVCHRPIDCLEALKIGAGAVLLTQEVLELPGAEELLRGFEAQPAWSDLPLLILTSGRDPRFDPLLDVAAKVAGGLRLLERPITEGSLLRSVHVALGARRRQYQVRDLLARSISERKRAEQALRESEEKHRLLFDTMAEGFGLNELIYDADGMACDWRFLEVNAAWEKQTGLARTDVVGKTMRQVWPDLDPCWLKGFATVALTGEPLRSEGYNPHLQGWYEVLAYRTKPNQFAVVFSDKTERKQAEEALRASEAKYRSLFNSLDDGFCIFEVLFGADGKANDYRFLEVNAAFERHSGLKNAEGKSIREMVPDQDAHWFETYGNVALTGEPRRFHPGGGSGQGTRTGRR